MTHVSITSAKTVPSPSSFLLLDYFYCHKGLAQLFDAGNASISEGVNQAPLYNRELKKKNRKTLLKHFFNCI